MIPQPDKLGKDRSHGGHMADKSLQLIIDALGRAASQPLGLPLIGGRNRAGLFSSSAIGKSAAKLAKDAGYLRVVRTETNGRRASEVCAITEKGLAHLRCQAAASNCSAAWKPCILSYLARWKASGALEDCPIPELYRQAVQFAHVLSVGQFHDGLRSLHEQEQIYLHPWTGPLYDLPEPQFALLVGHEVAYYVSLRDGARTEVGHRHLQDAEPVSFLGSR
jgi:hypothetical protein